MIKIKDVFSSYHPINNFLYFIGVIAFSMIFMHPVMLLISFICAFIYSLNLKGTKALKFQLAFIIPMVIFMGIVNPLLNHNGDTIFFYLNENPITKEAIIYGVASGLMIATVMVWFSCYNEVMSSDKFIYLFGRIIPTISLILSMVLGFVPKFKVQAKVIMNAQKSIGKDMKNGKLITRIKNGLNVLSILVSWALENSIETTDSMKCRGYGIKGRTTYSIYKFDKRDTKLLVSIIVMILILFSGMFLGELSVEYFPTITMKSMTLDSLIIYFTYAIFLLLPVYLNKKEDVKWAYLKSRD